MTPDEQDLAGVVGEMISRPELLAPDVRWHPDTDALYVHTDSPVHRLGDDPSPEGAARLVPNEVARWRADRRDRQRLREVLDVLGMAGTRDWDDVMNALRYWRKEREAT